MNQPLEPSADDSSRGDEALLLIAKGFPPTPGGVEQYSLQVAIAYVRAGLKVLVLTQTEGAAGWREHVSADGETVTVFNVGKGSQAIAALKMLRAVGALRRSARIRWIHATTWRVWWIGRLSFPSLPLYLTVHGREVLNTPRPLRWLMSVPLRSSRLTMYVSRATERAAREALQESESLPNARVSYNGITYPRLSRRDRPHPRSGTLRLLSLCRLVARKNVDASIRAAAALRESGRADFRLTVAGTGPEMERLRELVQSRELEQHVDLLGYVEDATVPALYDWADVFLHPHTHAGEGNDFEGFGIVIADAMSFGCVPVSGRSGGPAELVRPGVTGELVDGGDAEELAAVLSALYDDRERVSSMGEAAEEHAARTFSWDEHISPVLDDLGGRR